jgi:group I intron endonuclease
MDSTAFTGYVYLITNLVNGKRYVGCTRVSIRHRWAQHLSLAKKSNPPLALHRAIRKYGASNFKIECLETASTVEEMLKFEVAQIASHSCTVPNGYNLTNGGEGVDFSVPEARDKLMRGASKRKADPNWHRACSEGSRRRSATPEWHKNVVEAARRRSEDPECQEKLREGVHKRTADLSWRKNVAEGARRRAEDLDYIEACSKAAQRKLSDPEWRKANLEQLRIQHEDPEWQRANLEGLRKGRAIASARAVARDASLPLKVRLQRAKRRDQNRRYQAEKKARKAQATLGVS